VEPGATIGDGTRVWRHAHVRAGAVVGKNCTLAARVYVDAGVRIGDRVKIQDNVSVYAGVEIEDDVLVGPAAVFTNDLHPRAAGDWELVGTRIRRGASIGANATIVCGVEMGEGALVAAGAVVTRDVEPYELVAGNPARRLGWVCPCGRTLAQTDGPHPSPWRCAHCGRSSADDRPTIALHRVEAGPEAERLVRRVLRSGQLAHGPMVERFEREWAEAVAVRHAVAVTSGTSALLLALRALGIGAGDEVVTSALTFTATLSTIIETGATARFADVGDDFTMSVAGLGEVLGDRTRAVVPVHLYGLPADMPAIQSAVAGPVVLIEDAAQAAGARVDGRPVGSWGGAGCFSFYATKNLSTGEGGMVTTDDDDVAERVRRLRNHGRGPGGEHVIVGHNYRMTDLQAAIGVAQLGLLEEHNARRRANAARLTEDLAGLPGLVTPPAPAAGRVPAVSLYTVRVTPEARLTRDELARRLAEHGVETGVYYRRVVFDHPAFREHSQVVPAEVPMARRLAGEALSLPVHPYLTGDAIATVVRAVRSSL
jgi:dTDP-4-amino-4,6-dideoxygalactose transaminase/acetyltransferase-like isoleucine patch superfamily enzyme